MPTFEAPLRDMRFVLHEVFEGPTLWAQLPALAEFVDAATADAILAEAAKVTSQLISPLNRSGDEEGVHFDSGVVTTPSGFKDAYHTYRDGGWVGLAGNPAFGGMGMPKMLAVQFEEMMYGANSSFSLYSALSAGCCLAIDAHASESLKAVFLPKMYSGHWSGTMCLTEPHAGTDLGITRSRAEPIADGHYAVTGTKIFITGGDHDLTENIVHLVLARLPDAPTGPKGLSLFLVPKILVDADGQLGSPNSVTCGSVEHKMGIKASATCTMNFEGATGFLVGEEHRGLAAMFTMMNYERLSIGIQGVGCAQASYQNAAYYARDRTQGRAPNGAQAPNQIADPIIVHPDVRRMLLTMRALTEGGRAFATYIGKQLDISKYSENTQESAAAKQLVALLTPVAKAFFTDTGLESCVLGQQVFGGHGYIREWGQEQLVRDVRIAQIYEGTNGVQALDLLGRKVIADDCVALRCFATEIKDFCKHDGPYARQLFKVLATLEEVSRWLQLQAGHDANRVGSASVEYLHLFGYVAYAYMWARMATVAQDRIAQDPEFYSAKLATAAFYFDRVLPRVLSLEATIMVGSDSLYAMQAEQF